MEGCVWGGYGIATYGAEIWDGGSEKEERGNVEMEVELAASVEGCLCKEGKADAGEADGGCSGKGGGENTAGMHGKNGVHGKCSGHSGNLGGRAAEHSTDGIDGEGGGGDVSEDKGRQGEVVVEHDGEQAPAVDEAVQE